MSLRSELISLTNRTGCFFAKISYQNSANGNKTTIVDPTALLGPNI